MDCTRPVFRIGRTNQYVQPGDFVWADEMVAHTAAPGQVPVVLPEPMSGRVRLDGTVLLASGVLVPLANCRICRDVIRLG